MCGTLGCSGKVPQEQLGGGNAGARGELEWSLGALCLRSVGFLPVCTKSREASEQRMAPEWEVLVEQPWAPILA